MLRQIAPEKRLSFGINLAGWPSGNAGGVDSAGNRLRDLEGKFLTALAQVEKFESVASVAFLFGKEWSGRVFGGIEPISGAISCLARWC